MPAPKPVREMTQLLRETQKGHTNKLKQYKHTKYKPRLNIKHSPTGLYELVLVAVHMENETSDVQPKYQEPLQLLSPPFLMTSTTKQMRPNGRGAGAPAETDVYCWPKLLHCWTIGRVSATCLKLLDIQLTRQLIMQKSYSCACHTEGKFCLKNPSGS